MLLGGRVAIVTGAGAAPGRAQALCLARQGARLVVNDVSQQAADAVADEIESGGGEAIAIAAAVTDAAAVAMMASQAIEHWGRIDILVNHADVRRDRRIAGIAGCRPVVDPQLTGAAICVRSVWEVMRAQRHGRIVMTSAPAVAVDDCGGARLALLGLIQTLAIVGERYGIRVNCLASTAATHGTHAMQTELLALVGDGAGRQVAARWGGIPSRGSELGQDYGFTQAERELAHVRLAGSASAARH